MSSAALIGAVCSLAVGCGDQTTPAPRGSGEGAGPPPAVATTLPDPAPADEPVVAAVKDERPDCIAFELQTHRSSLPDFVHEKLREAYFERVQKLERVRVLDRAERTAKLESAGVSLTGAINQRAADQIIAGTDLTCHITAGLSLGSGEASAIFQVSLDDADPSTPPVRFAETTSSLVDAEMLRALDEAVSRLDER